jgi:DivIVA domain-containing protein
MQDIRWSVDRSGVRIATVGSRMYAGFVMSFIGTGIVLVVSLIAVGALGIAIAAVFEVLVIWQASRVRVEARRKGLLVRNWYRSSDLAWTAIARLEDGSVDVGSGLHTWALRVVPAHSGKPLLCRATSQGSDPATADIVDALREVAAAYGTTCTCTGSVRRGASREGSQSTSVADSGGVGDDLRHATFKEVLNGYARDEVRATLRRLADAIDADEPVDRLIPPRASFHRAFRGYSPHAVEARLDQLRAPTSPRTEGEQGTAAS